MNYLLKLFCANDVVVKTGCFRQIARIVFERFVFFVARPSVKALGSNPTAVTLRQVGQAPVERHTKHVATCPICLYQQNIAGVEPPYLRRRNSSPKAFVCVGKCCTGCCEMAKPWCLAINVWATLRPYIFF